MQGRTCGTSGGYEVFSNYLVVAIVPFPSARTELLCRLEVCLLFFPCLQSADWARSSPPSSTVSELTNPFQTGACPHREVGGKGAWHRPGLDWTLGVRKDPELLGLVGLHSMTFAARHLRWMNAASEKNETKVLLNLSAKSEKNGFLVILPNTYSADGRKDK